MAWPKLKQKHFSCIDIYFVWFKLNQTGSLFDRFDRFAYMEYTALFGKILIMPKPKLRQLFTWIGKELKLSFPQSWNWQVHLGEMSVLSHDVFTCENELSYPKLDQLEITGLFELEDRNNAQLQGTDKFVVSSVISLERQPTYLLLSSGRRRSWRYKLVVSFQMPSLQMENRRWSNWRTLIMDHSFSPLVNFGHHGCPARISGPGLCWATTRWTGSIFRRNWQSLVSDRSCADWQWRRDATPTWPLWDYMPYRGTGKTSLHIGEIPRFESF